MKTKSIKYVLLTLLVLTACICIVSCNKNKGNGNGLFGNNEVNQPLEYVLSTDGSYYIVAGIGDCTDTDIVIPSKHNGIPVRVIGTSAFEGCSHLTSVEIRPGVVTIESNAFKDCIGLKKMELSYSVEEIFDNAFLNCGDIYTKDESHVYVGSSSNPYYALIGILPCGKKNIGYYEYDLYPESCAPHNDTVVIASGTFYKSSETRKLYLGESLKHITYGAFYQSRIDEIQVAQKNSNYLVIAGNLYSRDRKTMVYYFENRNEYEQYEFRIFDFVTNLSPGVFYKTYYIYRVIIPDSIKEISPSAFSDSGISAVVIPKSVNKIDICAFYNCNNLNTIFYGGTAEDFSKIEIDLFNEDFHDAEIYYYRESEPLENGNFWYFDDEGNPVIWR